MRTKIKSLKHPQGGISQLVGKEVTVKGWVRTVRNQKTFAFIEVNDGSTLSNFQVVAASTLPRYDALINQLSTGVAVSITGSLVESPGHQQEVEMHAKEITIVGTCDPETYPLQKKRH